MLRLKLQRVGRRNRPSFRLVVTDRRTGPKSNKHVDIVGFYDPITKERRFEEEKIKNWLSKGVKPTDTVHNLLVDAGIIEGEKINVLPKKTPIKKEGEEVAEEKVEEEQKEATENSEETTEEKSE